MKLQSPPVSAFRGLLRRHGSLMLMIGVATATGIGCFVAGGVPALERAVGVTVIESPAIFIRVLAAMILAGFVQMLLPRDWISKRLGGQSGWSGLFTATIIGCFTVGGPMTSFPVVAALMVAGADIGCVVAFVLAWSLFGIQRMVVWEFPLLGVDFATLRVAISFCMPALAGWWVRKSVERDIRRRAAASGLGDD